MATSLGTGQQGQWDVFIAHAGPDQSLAERLFDVLDGRCRPFVASRCLRLGDDWDVALSKAQRASLMTVVLISDNTSDAFYQREEIAEAIALARNGRHVVVPLYVGADDRVVNPPYGLRVKHGLFIEEADADLGSIAERLIELLAEISRPGDAIDNSAEELKRALRPALRAIRDFVEEGLLEPQESTHIVRELIIKRLTSRDMT